MFIKDKRGAFIGICQESWAEVNFIKTAAGQLRGNHYHKETKELFFIISGRISVVVESTSTGEKTEFTAEANDMFMIEPGELHTFYTLTDAEWLNMLSIPMDNTNPDLHRK
ncbi:MAG: cupin domain-containing protein [Deltaproteobacteria bacterium]|nr:cupin domain-containing protein [Deltaproteobacteria bacterium]